jgi:hypothetical protein
VSKVRLVSDIHGNMSKYNEIIAECEYSIQLGDFGYDYTNLLSNVNPDRHKLIFGNHNSYDELFSLANVVRSNSDSPHFGMSSLNGFDFFFVRGAFSIDWKIRKERYEQGLWPQTYFPEEELSLEQCYQCLEQYKLAKPEIVLSHDCPRSIAKLIGDDRLLRSFGYDPETFTTRTSELLQSMIEIHKPKLWIHGHFHVSFNKVINGTQFVCLPEFGYMDLEYEK